MRIRDRNREQYGRHEGDDALSNTAPCFALGDSIDIIIENDFDESETDSDRPVNVYVSGGSDYAKVQMGPAADYEGAVGVSEYELDVPQPDRRKNPGEATITVTRSMGKTTGVVLVSIYDDDADFTALLNLESASTELPDSGLSQIDATMVIVFLGKPSTHSARTGITTSVLDIELRIEQRSRVIDNRHGIDDDARRVQQWSTEVASDVTNDTFPQFTCLMRSGTITVTDPRRRRARRLNPRRSFLHVDIRPGRENLKTGHVATRHL